MVVRRDGPPSTLYSWENVPELLKEVWNEEVGTVIVPERDELNRSLFSDSTYWHFNDLTTATFVQAKISDIFYFDGRSTTQMETRRDAVEYLDSIILHSRRHALDDLNYLNSEGLPEDRKLTAILGYAHLMKTCLNARNLIVRTYADRLEAMLPEETQTSYQQSL